MRKELVTGLLTLSLLASMLPANAAAVQRTAPETGLVQTVTDSGQTGTDDGQEAGEIDGEPSGGEEAEQTGAAAEINGTRYDTLEAAIAAAEENAVIQLLRDVELDATGLVNSQGALTLSKNLTLDGGGHRLFAKEGTFAVTGDNGGGPSLVNVQDGAAVTLRDITLDGGNAAKHGLNVYHAGTLSLENVEITNCRWYALVASNTELSVDSLTTSGNQWGINIDQGSRVTLANTEIAEGDSVVFEGQDDSGSLTVESGSFQNIKTQGASTGGTITITGGTIASVSNETGADVAITGGTVTGQVTNSGSGSISVTGGSFTTADVEEFVDPDQTVILTLDPAGGTCEVKTLAVASGAAVGTLPTPVREGYLFSGWFTAADGGSAVANDTAFDASTTLYAQWSEEDNGGSGGDSDNGSGGSDSDSGSDVDGEYLITVERVTGGTLRVNPGRADRGETVTITVTPKTGYELKELTVTDSRGGEIETRDAGEGRYTFVMPGSRVTVSADFARSGEQEDLPFTDVSSSAYYYDAVRWAAEEGITAGVTGTAFAPGRGCTRAQIVTFLWRANGSPEPTATENPFTDVRADSYYYQAVLWAVEEGITTGVTDSTFAPDAACTRAQAAMLLWRAQGSPQTSQSHAFRDVAEDAYYADAVNWAVHSGVTQGTTSATFEPDETCTRAQIVTFLYRALA